MSERDPTNPFAPLDNPGWLKTDDYGCTICPKCDGRQLRAVKNWSLGPGVYEIKCDKCNGHGWIEQEDTVRP